MFLQQMFHYAQSSRSLTRLSIWLFLVFLTGNTYSQQDLLPPIVINSEIEAGTTNWTDIASANQRTVRLEPNAVLLVKDKELTIRARRLEVSEGAKIMAFKEPAQPGGPGVNASDHRGKKPTTNGLNAGKVSIEVNELDGNLLIDLRGQDGGRGGDGYKGDNGSNAQWGKVGEHCGDWYINCCGIKWCRRTDDDFGWTSAGGQGGPGGDAGPGSNAGKGGTLDIKVKDNLQGCLMAWVGSGEPGQPGNPGAGGVGGPEPGPSPNQLNPPLPQKHGQPGKSDVAGAINISGSAQLLSLASLKPQRDQLRKKINDLGQKIAESTRIALGNPAQLSQFPHYRDWLTRQTERPWSLFDPFRHGASEEGQHAFSTLLQNPQLSGQDKVLLQTIRDQYIQFTFNNNQANVARKNISQHAKDKENAATKELPALEDWGRAEALPLAEGVQRCFGKGSPGGV